MTADNRPESDQDSAATTAAAQHAVTKFRDKTVQETIDGIVYTSDKLPTTTGLIIWPRLIRLLGEQLLAAVITGNLSVFEDDETGELSAIAAMRVAERADEIDFPDLARRLLANIRANKVNRIDGNEGLIADHFDEHFSGEYLHLIKVLVFAAQHNIMGPTLGSLLKSGSRTSPKAGPEAQTESRPQTSTP